MARLKLEEKDMNPLHNNFGFEYKGDYAVPKSVKLFPRLDIQMLQN